MDKSVFLKKVNTALKLCGLIRYDEITRTTTTTTTSNISIKLYKIYYRITSIYFYAFVSSQAYELINLFRSDNFVLLQLLNILSVLLLYSIAIVKVMVIRSKTMTNLYEEIYEQEVLILNGDDDDIKIIYERHVKFSNTMCKYFLWMAFACIMPFFCTPFVENLLNPIDEFYYVNDTKVYNPRPLPFVNWLPFDKYKYYKTAYGLHIMAGVYGASATAISDITFYVVTLYAVGQLEILQYLFKNFNEIAKKFENERDKDESVFFVIKCLVVLHRKIIRYIQRLNESMNILMLMDIFSTTLQIAVLGFQVVVIGGDWRLYQVFIFILTMLTQMSLFYIFANDITLESQKIARAIWESEWTEVSLKNKKNLAIVMVRAQKPLCLYVGPFYPMSTSTILSILRASYSYLALLKQVYA